MFSAFSQELNVYLPLHWNVMMAVRGTNDSAFIKIIVHTVYGLQ